MSVDDVEVRLRHMLDFARDFNILWQTVTKDLPPLVAALEKIVPPEPPKQET
jgi:uncharacterized protein with HEPN domain